MLGTPEENRTRQALLIVLVLSFCVLMFELLISRMSVFYLNYANAFLAIPLTLFGLAVGSLSVHRSKKNVEEFPLATELARLTVLSFLSFAVAFLLFSQFFPITHRTNVGGAQSFFKSAVFVAVFLPPFYAVGRILTALYAINRQRIGKIYGCDLLGASVACCVTPLLFHFIDLPYLIIICLLAMTGVTAMALGRAKIKTAGVFLVLSLATLPWLVFLEGRYDLRQAVADKHSIVREIAHRWNEFSRVSLVSIQKTGHERTEYKIVHDNAESNVYVIPYRPLDSSLVAKNSEVRAPFLLGRPTDDILVMFAGCGRDMIKFNAIGGGRRRLVGVEINPLVMDFALGSPELADYHLRDFFALPHVKMHLVEGRRFMDNDRTKYDVIYAGSDAATSQYKTGHSRKYLDTREAIEIYLDHLRPNGMLMFNCQPASHLIQSLKAVFNDRGMSDFKNHVALASRHRLDRCDDLMFSMSPYSEQDTQVLSDLFGRTRRYLPGRPNNRSDAVKAIEGPVLPKPLLVTDDRPYLHRLDFAGFKLIPSGAELATVAYYRSWIKITTMLLIALVLIGILAFLYVRHAPMPPPSMMLYLLVTGFCYMLVEITYIGKLELFLENPLYSMALLLTIFLMTNAAGSALYNRLRGRLPMNLMPLIVAGIVAVSASIIHSVIERRLGWSLPVKTVITVLIISPVGLCLGFFYPHVVTWLAGHGRDNAVPVTYAISTLSSVAGATYAMMMIINFGYTNIIYQAAIGYAALAVIMLAHRFATGNH